MTNKLEDRKIDLAKYRTTFVETIKERILNPAEMITDQCYN